MHEWQVVFGAGVAAGFVLGFAISVAYLRWLAD